jgi:multidrug efflux pump subunit AcrA (membrane-fusion protein)
LPAVRRRRAIWAGCAVLAGLMLLLPWRERATGDCALLPRARAVVASEIAGRLSEVLVREGSVVEAGQPIARLDTGALEADLEIARQDRLRQEAEAQRMQGLGEMGNYRVLSHEVERLRQTERRLAGEIERSTLRSPIRGVVLTKDVDLRRGEVLPLGQEFCEVASLENWDLRIQVPEDQIGLLLGALQSRGSLPVSYVLEARSDLRLSTDLKSADQIGQAANAEARRNFFYVTFAGLDLPEALRADLRPGYTGRARIDLQRRPLGLVLTRRFVHLLRMHWIV